MLNSTTDKEQYKQQNWTKTQNFNYDQAYLNGLNLAVCNNFDTVLDALGLESQPFAKYFALPCPIHGGDNPRGLTFYHNSEPHGAWQCNTHGCHNYFKKNAIGFIRGVLSGKKGWTSKNNRIASFNETLEFCRAIVGHTDIKNLPKNRILSEYKPKKEIPKGIARDVIRKRLIIPSEFFTKKENGGFLPETLNFFDVGEPINKNSKMGNRVIIPIYDENFLYIGCQGRHKDPNIDKGSRWINSDNLPLESILYNIHQAKAEIVKTREIILVESPKSVWRLWEAGIKNAVAILGNFKSGQKIILETSGAATIRCMFDNDEAGNNYYETISKKCGKLFNVEKVTYGKENDDPANLDIMEIKDVFGI